jgi:hypothetical protein
MKTRILLLLISFGALIVMLFAPDARADANSYLGYLQSHGTFAGGQAKALNAGLYACSALHAGQTPDQILGGVHMTFMDVRGVIDAAQHELCPDTLGH